MPDVFCPKLLISIFLHPYSSYPFLLRKVFSYNHFSFFGLSALLIFLNEVINLMPNHNLKDQAFIFVCAPLGRFANA
jgi:hypothetical protein